MGWAKLAPYLAIGVLAAGIALLAVAAAAGDAELSIVVVFPVVSGTGAIFAAGAFLLVAGFFLVFLTFSMRLVGAAGPLHPTDVGPPPPPAGDRAPPAAPRPGSSQWGGVVFVGPFPIAFGSNPRMNRLMLVAAIVMALLFFVFLLGALT